MDDASSRYLKNRKPQEPGPTAEELTVREKPVQVVPKKEKSGLSLFDILRVLAGFFLLSASLSYLIVGDSFTWGYDPKWAKWQSLRKLWVCLMILNLFLDRH